MPLKQMAPQVSMRWIWLAAASLVHASPMKDLAHHRSILRRGGVNLAQHPKSTEEFEFRQLGATCNVEEADAFWQTHPFVHSVTATHAQIRVMQAVKELKGIMLSAGLPIVLVRDILLGWRRSCFALPGETSATVATFGAWLGEVEIPILDKALRAQGHRLDTSGCGDGPTEAGCRLQARFRVEKVWIPVDILVFQFTSSQDKPGCDTTSCGRDCTLCPLALQAASHSSSARPLPVRAFRLALWLNDTFWIPADVDRYLAAEYGPTWFESGSALLPPGGSHASSLLGPGLPPRAQVLGLQKKVEHMSASTIATAVSSELQLWQRYFPEVRSSLWRSGETSPLFFGPFGPLQAGNAQTAQGASTSVWLVFGGFLLAVYCFTQEHDALRLPRAVFRQCSSAKASVFGFFCFLSCAQPLLQHEAGTARAQESPMELALAMNLLQGVAVTGVWAACLFQDRSARKAKGYEAQRRFPAWLLIIIAGVCQSMALWLTFVALTYLDPLSFLLLGTLEAFLRPLLFGQRSAGLGWSWTRSLTLAFLCLAVVCQGQELLSSGGRDKALLGAASALSRSALGLSTSVCQSWLANGDAARSGAPGDARQALQLWAGFLVLMGYEVIQTEALLLTSEFWHRVALSRFVPALAVCTLALTVGRPYLLKEVPPALLAWSPGVCMLSMALLQTCCPAWVGAAPPSARSLQASLLYLAAAWLHAVQSGQPTQGPAPATPEPAQAQPWARLKVPEQEKDARKGLARTRRPPPPRPFVSAGRKESSEVGSTCTPPLADLATTSDLATNSDMGTESDCDTLRAEHG